jgi:hypothetical protein
MRDFAKIYALISCNMSQMQLGGSIRKEFPYSGAVPVSACGQGSGVSNRDVLICNTFCV